MKVTSITPDTSAWLAIKPAAGATVQPTETKSAAAQPPPARPPAEAPAAQTAGTASQTTEALKASPASEGQAVKGTSGAGYVSSAQETTAETARALEKLYGLPFVPVVTKRRDTAADDSSTS